MLPLPCHREACKYIQEKLSISSVELERENVVNCAKTSMSSKLVGVDSDFFANMIVDAAMSIKRTGNKGETKVPIKSINVLKAHGGNMKESISVPGYALNCTVACEGTNLLKDNASRYITLFVVSESIG